MLRGPQGPAHVEPGHVGQAQVEQHQVGFPLGEGGQPGRAVGGLAHLVALVLQGHGQRQADLVVVFDEQQGVHSPAILPGACGPVRLLQKSRRLVVAPSQPVTMMSTVHAAPVGCLPPPGASPAAVDPCHTGVLCPGAVRCACAPRSPCSSGSSRSIASVSLTVVTYAFARSSLLEQRAEVARQQAVLNALQVREFLRDGTEGFGDYFPTIRTETDGFAAIHLGDGRSASTRTQFSYDELPRRPPPGRRRRGLGGAARSTSATTTTSASACTSPTSAPTTSRRSSSARPRARCARSCWPWSSARRSRCSWRPASGWWTSRRLLRPLGRITDAAGEIAAGDLDTRVAREGDPDLDRLADSFNDMADAVQARIEREARFASRRQPRAALPDHRPGRRRRGHQRPAWRAPRPHPAGPRRRRRPGAPLRRHGDRPARAVAHRRRGDRPAHRGGRHRRPVRPCRRPQRLRRPARSRCRSTSATGRR